jgi:hypothetical protein
MVTLQRNKIYQMILQYFINVLINLKLIHIGTLTAKLQAAAKLGFFLSFPAFIFEMVVKWGVNNSDYVGFCMLAIVIDHILGTIRHLFIDKDFTIKQNIKGMVIKIGLVVCVGLLFEGLNSIVKSDSIIKEYLIMTTRLMVFLYPAGSAFGNSSILSGGKFPPTSWIDKLKKFQKNLDTNEFKNKNEDK